MIFLSHRNRSTGTDICYFENHYFSYTKKYPNESLTLWGCLNNFVCYVTDFIKVGVSIEFVETSEMWYVEYLGFSGCQVFIPSIMNFRWVSWLFLCMCHFGKMAKQQGGILIFFFKLRQGTRADMTFFSNSPTPIHLPLVNAFFFFVRETI